MKVHILQIPTDGRHYEGEESNAMLDLREPDVRPVGPVRYSLDVGLSDGGLWAAGQIAADVEVRCVRCLEDFTYPAEVPDFACQVELTGAETVDLTPPMREDILLALPAHPHCDWSGAKVCSGAPPVSVTGTAAHEQPAEPRGAWKALDQLKINP